jgi:hypothetical protein
MLRTTQAILVTGVLMLAGGVLDSHRAEAGHPDLFYNYYVGPPSQAGAPAQLYLSPRPTPPLVGHTWITYPPFEPHEYLYHHKRTYYKYCPEGGYTKTTVRWY